ncbi:MAG: chemotaxis protein [Pseudolabrys sp.]
MQRKVFRIEQMVAERAPRAMARSAVRRNEEQRLRGGVQPAHATASDQSALQDLKREFDTISAAIERGKHELAALHANTGEDARLARARQALAAAVANMEKATQKILKSAEAIDEGARTLHATLKNDYDCGLSQDIIDQVVRIYEACNFQDLSGQHIAKAIDTLAFVEERVTRVAGIWGDVTKPDMSAVADNGPVGRSLVNGPKIDGDSGHVDQNDVDNLFGCA